MPWRNPTRALFLAMIVNLLLVLTGAFFTLNTLAHNCDRRIGIRDDNRVMWVWLFDEFPDNAAAIEGRVLLDDRLPALRCSWWRAVPVTGEDQ